MRTRSNPKDADYFEGYDDGFNHAVASGEDGEAAWEEGYTAGYKQACKDVKTVQLAFSWMPPHEVVEQLPIGEDPFWSAAYTFQAFVEGMTYKPGYKFKAQIPVERDEVIVLATAAVPDVNDPTKTTQVYQSRIFPGHVIDRAEPKEWMGLLYNLIIDLEMHEVDEWLKFFGNRYHDPHPPRD